MLAFLEGLAAVARVDGVQSIHGRVTYLRTLLNDINIGQVTVGNVRSCGNVSVTAITTAALVRCCFRWTGPRGQGMWD